MDALTSYLTDLTGRPAAPGIVALAEMLVAQHPGTSAVLAYGSALREAAVTETLIDYYLLVDDAAALPGGLVLRALAALAPPNVCYAERLVGVQSLRCKYAVMTVAQFQQWVSPKTANPYVWARFAQPSRLVWCRNAASRALMIESLATACRTAFAHARFLSAERPWPALFTATYRTELRPESAGRAEMIVAAEQQHYAALTRLLADVQPLASHWGWKRAMGKLWSLARLAKAAFTFQGGADYAAWKIARHSGIHLEVTPWQRRHPFLAGIMLLPKLLRLRGLK